MNMGYPNTADQCKKGGASVSKRRGYPLHHQSRSFSQIDIAPLKRRAFPYVECRYMDARMS